MKGKQIFTFRTLHLYSKASITWNKFIFLFPVPKPTQFCNSTVCGLKCVGPHKVLKRYASSRKLVLIWKWFLKLASHKNTQHTLSTFQVLHLHLLFTLLGLQDKTKICLQEIASTASCPRCKFLRSAIMVRTNTAFSSICFLEILWSQI